MAYNSLKLSYNNVIFCIPILKIDLAKCDGDVATDRPVFTIEANEDAEKQINSLSYFLNVQGGNMRDDGKDFQLTAYMMTHVWNPPSGFKLEDINKEKMKYHV